VKINILLTSLKFNLKYIIAAHKAALMTQVAARE